MEDYPRLNLLALFPKRDRSPTTLVHPQPIRLSSTTQVANLLVEILDTPTNMTTVPGATISKRRKFVADGVFYAELNEFFQRELAEEGYSGVEVRVTPTVTDISMSYWLLFYVYLDVLTDYQSSAQHTPKKSSASRGAAFESLPPSSKSASSSLKTPSPSTPPRSRTVVSLRLPSASLCATNY